MSERPAGSAPRSGAFPLRHLLASQLLVDLVYVLLSPLALLYVLVVSRCFLRPKYRRGLLQKLGFVARVPPGQTSFWVHAVSVGEVKTSLPLIRALQERFPDGHIGLSVATFTGFEVARKSLPHVDIFYAPLDLSLITARVFRRRRPTALVLVELELWPNFLMTARRRGVPVFVVNGRITERSARRYRKLSCLSRSLFRCVDGYAVQDEAYRERFLGLGVEPGRVEVLGNLKHDVQPAAVGEPALASAQHRAGRHHVRGRL